MKYTKLNVGCGGDLLPGYINIDMVDWTYFGNEIPEDCEYRMMNALTINRKFIKNSFAEIKADYFMEHLTPVEVSNILYQFHEVAIEGAMLRLLVPDITYILNNYGVNDSDGNWRKDLKMNLLCYDIFNADQNDTGHKSVWTKEIGEFYLTNEGLWELMHIDSGVGVRKDCNLFIARKIG